MGSSRRGLLELFDRLNDLEQGGLAGWVPTFEAGVGLRRGEHGGIFSMLLKWNRAAVKLFF